MKQLKNWLAASKPNVSYFKTSLPFALRADTFVYSNNLKLKRLCGKNKALWSERSPNFGSRTCRVRLKLDSFINQEIHFQKTFETFFSPLLISESPWPSSFHRTARSVHRCPEISLLLPGTEIMGLVHIALVVHIWEGSPSSWNYFFRMFRANISLVIIGMT